MVRHVELLSAMDPIYVRPRSTWYWAEMNGVLRTPRTRSYVIAYDWAMALSEEHEASLVDRSDRGTSSVRSSSRP
jgi:hypothetical protein